MTTNTEKNEKAEKKTTLGTYIAAYAAFGVCAFIGYKFGFNAGVKKAFDNTRIVGETYASIYNVAKAMKD